MAQTVRDQAELVGIPVFIEVLAVLFTQGHKQRFGLCRRQLGGDNYGVSHRKTSILGATHPNPLGVGQAVIGLVVLLGYQDAAAVLRFACNWITANTSACLAAMCRFSALRIVSASC